jgi:hypothetical protein
LIRRRHVIYVEGYDPQGAKGYYRLFERSWKRFLKAWPIDGQLGRLAIDSPDLAHWGIEADGALIADRAAARAIAPSAAR